MRLPGDALPLRREPTDDDTRRALRVDAPSTEADLAPVLDAVAKGAAAGAALVTVFGGTPLTRRLLCEEARLGCDATPCTWSTRSTRTRRSPRCSRAGPTWSRDGRPGRDDRAAEATLFGSFEQISLRRTNLVENGDHVAAEFVVTATHTKELPLPDGSTLPATGKVWN